MEDLLRIIGSSLPTAWKWMLIVALVLYGVIRLLKEDVKFTPNLPSNWRSFLVVVLGIVAGSLKAVVSGTPWKVAAFLGFVAACTAMLGHDIIVKGPWVDILKVVVALFGKAEPVPAPPPPVNIKIVPPTPDTDVTPVDRPGGPPRGGAR